MSNQNVNDKCPRCGGEVCVVNEFGVMQCRSCQKAVWRTRQEFEREVQKGRTRYERFLIWFEARIRRGKRRHEELANSPRYLNALARLRLRYNIPPSSFSTNDEVDAWTHWFNQEVDRDTQARKRPDRRIGNRLQLDCEKVAKKYRVVGGWTIVRRHMLYGTAIKDFSFDEGWFIDSAEDKSNLVIRPNATQETLRSGKRFLKLSTFPKQLLSRKP